MSSGEPVRVSVGVSLDRCSSCRRGRAGCGANPSSGGLAFTVRSHGAGWLGLGFPRPAGVNRSPMDRPEPSNFVPDRHVCVRRAYMAEQGQVGLARPVTLGRCLQAVTRRMVAAKVD